ncbi:MAG TPA: hypothetical protein VFI46_08080, partial [Jiangellaceae bacterium]|nr:hypothetical protein [Jiangellaceae bacterium]
GCRVMNWAAILAMLIGYPLVAVASSVVAYRVRHDPPGCHVPRDYGRGRDDCAWIAAGIGVFWPIGVWVLLAVALATRPTRLDRRRARAEQLDAETQRVARLERELGITRDPS